jgi:hypothetical protein
MTYIYIYVIRQLKVKPQAEYKFRDYLMILSQLQALRNVQQRDAEMARSTLIKVQLLMGCI